MESPEPIKSVGLTIIARLALAQSVMGIVMTFAFGALSGWRWSRPFGLILAAVSLLLTLIMVIIGGAISRAVLLSIIPVIMIWYLHEPKERQALKGNSM